MLHTVVWWERRRAPRSSLWRVYKHFEHQEKVEVTCECYSPVCFCCRASGSDREEPGGSDGDEGRPSGAGVWSLGGRSQRQMVFSPRIFKLHSNSPVCPFLLILHLPRNIKGKKWKHPSMNRDTITATPSLAGCYFSRNENTVLLLWNLTENWETTLLVLNMQKKPQKTTTEEKRVRSGF